MDVARSVFQMLGVMPDAMYFSFLDKGHNMRLSL